MVSSTSIDIASFGITYATSKCSLICIVKRYTLTVSSDLSENSGLSILIAMPGLGFTSDLWFPVIERIFSLQSQPGCTTRVLSIWVVDRPNHGDAAVLNEEALRTFHNEFFSVPDHAAAITAFLSSDLLSAHERENLVGLAHSSGTVPLIASLPTSGKLPIRSLILIESLLMSREVYPIHLSSVKSLLARATQPGSWNSIDEAMTTLQKIYPWNKFNQENLEILKRTFFIPVDLSREDGPVKTKTAFHQQMIVWGDFKMAYDAAERFHSSIVHQLPCHLIQGLRHDPGIYPKAVFDAILKQIQETHTNLASVTRIQGAGHCLPHENPDATATAIIKALSADQLTSRM
ncbi:Alpha/beta hydrolase fold-1 [Mycena floridula]|nr:Alpha/beta hydrolase fold-1 [Mycena floridula]